MVAVEGDDSTMVRCPECAGLWLDVAEVNRILLRHNMPGLESLGGFPDPDESVGLCPECQVDLVAVEGGERRSLHYDTCEVCGGIFIETETETAEVKAAMEAVAGFYRRFHHTKAK
jgi:Zn-finger nucleic acid-binding protein